VVTGPDALYVPLDEPPTRRQQVSCVSLRDKEELARFEWTRRWVGASSGRWQQADQRNTQSIPGLDSHNAAADRDLFADPWESAERGSNEAAEGIDIFVGLVVHSNASGFLKFVHTHPSVQE
jgi:hypothetical protein